MHTEQLQERLDELTLTNGAILPIRLQILWAPETDSAEGDFDFGSKEENEAYLNRFESGELQNIYIVVKATYSGVEGFDSLGMCHVKTKTFSGDVMETVESHGMIDNAVNDLRTNLEHLLKHLSPKQS